jgi:hypothetical protein
MLTLKRGNLFYFKKINKTVPIDQYDPVSYEQWKMLRELEPTKFRNTYAFYVKSRQEQYEAEVEKRKDVLFELLGFTYSLYERDLAKTKQQIIEIESDPFFDKWHNEEIKNIILNYE